MYPSKGFFRNVVFQPYNDMGTAKLQKAAKGSKYLLQRLALEKQLDCHLGAVNSLSWSSDGCKLLSAGDDRRLVVSDPFSYKIHLNFFTQHRTNIFCAKFLPISDNRIVSCDANGSILNLDVQRLAETETNFLNCHQRPCYELETISSEPYTFLSCSEDGTVRLYDIRCRTSCSKQKCLEDILIDCGKPINAIAINPLRPYQLAMATSDSVVRVVDRRTISVQDRTHKITPVCTFTVPHLKHRSYRMTSLSFSPDGEDLLVNYSNENIYLFSVNTDSNATTILNNYLKNSPRPPPYKRLRLRGDWSDTGPSSQPASNSSETSRMNTTLMQRLSLMLMQMMNNANRLQRINIILGIPNIPTPEEMSMLQYNNEEDLGLEPLDTSVLESNNDVPMNADSSNVEPSRTVPSTSNDNHIEQSASDRDNRRVEQLLKYKKLKHTMSFNDFVPVQPIKAHYKGHRNSRTMIKKATFWGNDFIMSGSDCGHLFVWDRYTCEIVMLLEADSRVLNCVLPHPSRLLLATSGTDQNLKLWSPTSDDNTFSQSFANELVHLNKILSDEAADTITVPAMFVVRMIAYFTQMRQEGRTPSQTRYDMAHLLTQMPDYSFFSRVYDNRQEESNED